MVKTPYFQCKGLDPLVKELRSHVVCGKINKKDHQRSFIKKKKRIRILKI